MAKQPRWMKSAIATAAETHIDMPWTRDASRITEAAMIAAAPAYVRPVALAAN